MRPHQSLIFKLSSLLLMAGLLYPGESSAMSPIPSKGGVILIDDIPCFYTTFDEQVPFKIGWDFDISAISPKGNDSAWSYFESERNIKYIKVPTAKNCLKYGQGFPNAGKVDKPKPLQYDIPYLAHFSMAGHGVGWEKDYEVYFCLRQDKNGKAYLAELNSGRKYDEQPCSATPLGASLWQRLFGD